MMLVLRPTEKGSGLHDIKDLDKILKLLGYDYLCSHEGLEALT
jgi:hypothetical protein